jgi:thiol-disulfide isomerase/thioredoxin
MGKNLGIMKLKPGFSTSNLLIVACISLCLYGQLAAQTCDVELTIHLRGVYESKISLLGLNSQRLFKPITEVPGVKNGETAVLTVQKEHLPGEFVLRFDYRELETSTPYPSEKSLIINQQNLELWISPVFCNNPDSSYFQEDEIENSTYQGFSMENAHKKEKLGLLQNFLMSYDETDSKFYQEGIKEYEKRRTGYNQWLAEQIRKDAGLFVSSMYFFQYVPQIPWKGAENERLNSMIAHYFDGMDFKNPDIIRTSFINKWMDNYVNLYGQMSTTTALRDSLFPLAGKTAIEKAKSGNPVVYGWMVDYFYRGYETNGIDAGMKILQPYLDDPNCLTSKRMEIERRLKGIETLVAGSMAPPINMEELGGGTFDLYSMKSKAKYTLILFWSGDCSHCEELTQQLYPWQQQPEISKELAVLAISLDETDTEIAAWLKKKQSYVNWKHLRAPGGVNSKEANDYFVLATPVMALINQETKTIVGLPNSISELKSLINKE